jgi:hypothetical protein
MTQGEIGSLSVNGEQVGGFLDWQIIVQTQGTKPGVEAVHTKAIASAFWIIDHLPADRHVEAIFYSRDGNKLILINQANVLISSVPPCIADKLIRHPMEMVFQ